LISIIPTFHKTQIFNVDIGGAEGARTPDLIAASDALSQLSYSPILTNKTLLRTIIKFISISIKPST
jgi:hypothetical protein